MEEMDKKKLDLIINNPKKAIMVLSVPLMISVLVDLINDVVNSIWLSTLGEDALAAFGFINPLVLIVVGIGIGLGAGCSSVMAKFVGQNNKDEATNVAFHSVILAVVLFILLPIICLIFMEPIFLLLGAGEVIELTCSYGFYFLIGLYAFGLPFVLQPILVIGGDTKKASVPLVISAIANVFLNPVFIFYFDLGISGSAISTVFCQTIFGILPMVYWIFIKQNTFLIMTLDKFKLKLNIYKDLLLVGIPAAMEEAYLAILAANINIILVGVSSTTAVAVYSTSWRLIELGLSPIFGIGMAAVTVIGYHYGAQNWDKFKLSFSFSAKFSIVIGILIFILFYIFANPLASIFALAESSAGLDTLIANCLRVLGIYLITSSVGYIVTYYLQAVEKGVQLFCLALFKEVICCLAIIVICVYGFNMGEFGVYLGMILGGLAGSIILYIYAKYDIRKIINSSAN